MGSFQRNEVWWEGKRKGKAEERSGSEGMVVSPQDGRVPDRFSRRKDITLFAPIIPHSAETLKTRRFPRR